jgi:Pyruvate/2-oxoacid:ferredoxin oxidoreductase delta subunit
VALDRIIMELLGLNPAKLITLLEAQKAGIGEINLKNIQIIGNNLKDLIIDDFKTPTRIQSLRFERIPSFLYKYARNFFTARPLLLKKSCIHCGRCFQACPNQAINWKKGGKPLFIYSRCIRCFCCQEMCQSKAIIPKDGFGLVLLKPFRKYLQKKWGV